MGKIKISRELRLGPPVHGTVVEPVDVFGSICTKIDRVSFHRNSKVLGCSLDNGHCGDEMNIAQQSSKCVRSLSTQPLSGYRSNQSVLRMIQKKFAAHRTIEKMQGNHCRTQRKEINRTEKKEKGKKSERIGKKKKRKRVADSYCNYCTALRRQRLVQLCEERIINLLLFISNLRLCMFTV